MSNGARYAFGHCRLCERDVWVTAHHVTPVEMETRGYPHEGVVPLCRICHDFLHEDVPNVVLANGGPEFLTQWMRKSRDRVAEYRNHRDLIASRRKGGANYVPPLPPQPKWKRKQQKKVDNAVKKSRLLYEARLAFPATPPMAG